MEMNAGVNRHGVHKLGTDTGRSEMLGGNHEGIFLWQDLPRLTVAQDVTPSCHSLPLPCASLKYSCLQVTALCRPALERSRAKPVSLSSCSGGERSVPEPCWVSLCHVTLLPCTDYSGCTKLGACRAALSTADQLSHVVPCGSQLVSEMDMSSGPGRRACGPF